MRRFFPLLLTLLLFSCTHIKLARDAYKQENYKETIIVCKKILAADSTNIKALELLSDAYLQLDVLDSAVFVVERQARLQPENQKTVKKLYRLYLAQGEHALSDDPKKARLVFAGAAELIPERAAAFEKMGDAFFLQKQFVKSRTQYQAALQRHADSTSVQKKLAAIDSLQNLANVAYEHGMTFLKANKYDAAKSEFAKALEITPFWKEAKYQFHMASGMRLYKKGSVNALWDAIDNFATASLLHPDRAEPHYFLGLAYNKKDKDEYANALDELHKAVQIEPESKWAKAAKKEAKKIVARKKKMEAFWSK